MPAKASKPLTRQRDVAEALQKAQKGQSYVAIAPFAWSIGPDPVKAIQSARALIPRHVPRAKRAISLFLAPSSAKINLFNGRIIGCPPSDVCLVAKLPY